MALLMRRVKQPGGILATMLKAKVIVVTGASRGIGEAIVRASIDAGAKVVLASRKQADLDKVAGSLPADRTIAVACHTGKPEDVEALFTRAVDKFGRIDGVVNNASVAGLRAAPMQGIYGATKAAVISMTQTLAFELGGSAIRVNAIAPGL